MPHARGQPVDERPLRVFVDTNVWVSAFINADGAPAKILEAFLAGQFVPVISQVLLEEIDGVVHRPRIRRRWRFTDADLATILTLLRDRAIEAVPAGDLLLCRDPSDNLLLETAVLGQARYAVSRDDDIKRDLDLMARLKEQGVEVVSVAQFLNLLAEHAA